MIMVIGLHEVEGLETRLRRLGRPGSKPLDLHDGLQYVILGQNRDVNCGINNEWLILPKAMLPV